VAVILVPFAAAKPASAPILLQKWTFDRLGRPSARWRPAAKPARG
jgi:hypothetical protein